MNIYNNIKLTILFFLGTNCPITQNTTLEINRIFEKYKDNQFEFIAVFPNLDDNNNQIQKFQDKYQIKFDCHLDSNQYLTKKFEMTTLPEVVVFSEDSLILYKGKIDDLYFDIGKRTQKEYKKILDLKLDSIKNNKLPKVKYIKPLGCVIEKR